MLAICFWFRMTSMAAHTYWTTLGSACLFFATRDMISLFIATVRNKRDASTRTCSDQYMGSSRFQHLKNVHGTFCVAAPSEFVS